MIKLLPITRFKLECFIYTFIPFAATLGATTGRLPTWQQCLLACGAAAAGLKGKLSSSSPNQQQS